jgi:hypothetical protein
LFDVKFLEVAFSLKSSRFSSQHSARLRMNDGSSLSDWAARRKKAVDRASEQRTTRREQAGRWVRYLRNQFHQLIFRLNRPPIQSRLTQLVLVRQSPYATYSRILVLCRQLATALAFLSALLQRHGMLGGTRRKSIVHAAQTSNPIPPLCQLPPEWVPRIKTRH